jgi:hypothetical protein
VIATHGLITLAAVSAGLAAGVAPATAGSRAPQLSPGGSCKPAEVPAIINARFACLKAGGACTAKFQQAYTKYRFTCTAARLSKVPAARQGSLLADAFLNTKSSDSTTRVTTFRVGGPPPILHMTFASALKGSHTLTVDVHNSTINSGQSFDTTLKPGWQFAYEVLPALVSNSAAGDYVVTVTIDGGSKKLLTYSVTP